MYAEVKNIVVIIECLGCVWIDYHSVFRLRSETVLIHSKISLHIFCIIQYISGVQKSEIQPK